MAAVVLREKITDEQGNLREMVIWQVEPNPRQPERETKEGRERKPEAGQGDPVARFKQAQKEFIQVAGLADFDPRAKIRSAELRDEMKRASQEIAKDPVRMRAAERDGFAPQVKNFVRKTERERGREKGRGVEKDEGLER